MADVITVDLDTIKSEMSSLLASYLGKMYDNTLFQSFHDQFRELLRRHNLSDLRVFIRQPLRPNDFGYDPSAATTISIVPMRAIDAITLHTILGDWSAALQVKI